MKWLLLIQQAAVWCVVQDGLHVNAVPALVTVGNHLPGKLLTASS
jgi:hypothetical protein